MDVNEKEELIKLLLKYQDEVTQKLLKHGSFIGNPFTGIVNSIADVRSYLSLEVIEQNHRKKNQTEDIEKAIWYLNRYLELAKE